MSKKILIGYYSKTGTTKKVCSIMDTVLTKAGFEVDVNTFSSVKSLEPYDTVIVAAPINGMQWVELAKVFITENATALQLKQVVVIYITYILRHGNKFWSNKIVKGIETLTQPIKPMIIKDFGGIVDKEFPTFARWIFGIKKGTSLDASDDKEVEIFAETLIEKLI